MSGATTMTEKQIALMANITTALKVRQAGNEKFKNGDLSGALRDYHTVLLSLRGLEQTLSTNFERNPLPIPFTSSNRPSKRLRIDFANGNQLDEQDSPEPEEQVQQEPEEEHPQKTVERALVNTFVNSSAIHIEMKRYQRALECALQAQRIDERNCKAKFREAQARLGLGQVAKAKLLLELLQQELGPEAGIARTLAQVEYDQRQREKAKEEQSRGASNEDKTEPNSSTSTTTSTSNQPQLSTTSTATPANTSSTAPASETSASAASSSCSTSREQLAEPVHAQANAGDTGPLTSSS
ncbi:hypothetical protein JCM3765_004612 [Sporobolomyces pararoseus]